MNELFCAWQIHSITKPNKGVGLSQGFPPAGKFYTREALERFNPPIYRDTLIEWRGEECLQEQFVLQGLPDGQQLSYGKWVTIKDVQLRPGKEPEPDWGNCRDCGTKLEESEAAIGVICSGCLEKEHDRRESLTW